MRLHRILSAALLCAAAALAYAQDGAAPGESAQQYPPHSEEPVRLMEEARAAMDKAQNRRTRFESRRDGLRSTLEILQEDHEALESEYEEGREPIAKSDVRDRIRALDEAIELSEKAEFNEIRSTDRERVARRLAVVRQQWITLGERYVAWEKAARGNLDDEEWDAQRELWDALEEEHQAAIEDLLQARREAATLLDECRTLRQQIRAQQVSTRVLIGRKNLLMRGESAITVSAVVTGLEDVRLVPGWLHAEASEALAYARSPGNIRELTMTLGLSVLIVLGLLLARRRLRARLARPNADGEQPFELLGWIAAAVLLSLAIATTPLLVGTLLSGLSEGASRTWMFLGLLAAGLAFLRRLTSVLLPDGDGWTPLELDPTSVMYIRAGTRLILYGTLVLVPIALALGELGYENVGARQAVWLLYKLLVVAVILLFFLRKPVVRAMTTKADTRLGRMVRWGVAFFRPIVVIAVPVLLAIDLLEYDLLATFLVKVLGGVLGGVLVALLAYRVLWSGLAAWIRRVVHESEDVGADEHGSSTLDAALSIGQHATRVVVVIVGVLVMFLIQGGDLDSTRAFLEVDLPFQGTTDGHKVTLWGVIVGLSLLLFFLTSVPKIKQMLDHFVLPHTSMDAALRYTVSTLVGYTFAAAGLYVGLIQIFDLSAIGYVFAALSVGIGFGLQEIVSNFISGLILLFERPIKVGDVVTVGQTEGTVEKINIRATRIQTLDNVSLLIPNKDFITQPVVNSVYSDTIIRLRVPVGVAYGSDTALVKRILEDIGNTHRSRLRSRPAQVLFLGFGASSLDFELRIWLPEVQDRFAIASELRFEIDAKFREHDIEIPFPQHDLHLRSVDGEAAQILRGEARDGSAADDPPSPEGEPEVAGEASGDERG